MLRWSRACSQIEARDLKLSCALARCSLYPRLPTSIVVGSMSEGANIGSRSSSVNNLVGAQQNCFGDGHSKGFGGFEVHDQLEPRRALDGEVCRLGAAQNPTDITAATAKHIRKVRSVGDETSRVHVRPVKVNRRQPSLLCEISDLCSVSETKRI